MVKGLASTKAWLALRMRVPRAGDHPRFEQRARSEITHVEFVQADLLGPLELLPHTPMKGLHHGGRGPRPLRHTLVVVGPCAAEQSAAQTPRLGAEFVGPAGELLGLGGGQRQLPGHAVHLDQPQRTAATPMDAQGLGH